MNREKFDVVFAENQHKEIIVGNWETGKNGNSVYEKAQFNQVEITVLPGENNIKYIRFFNRGREPVTGFWGIRFPWSFGENDYTLIPALFYNGNSVGINKEIPFLEKGVNNIFAASFCSASYPCVLYKNGTTGKSYTLSHKSIAGWNGVELDAEKETMTVFAPAREEKIYSHRGYKETGRKPYSLEPDTILTVRIEEEDFNCIETADLLDYYWENTLRKKYYFHTNAPKISPDKAADLLLEWMYKRHCFVTEKGYPIISNAFLDVDCDKPHLTPEFAEWNNMIGWCSGSMTALTLLYAGGKYRDFAVKYLDFLSTHGNSPSGVKYPVFDGETWMTQNHPQFSLNAYEHLRFYCEYITYLGRAIRLEKKNGYAHPLWEKDFKDGIEIITDLWEREGDFGLYWNIESSKPEIKVHGTAAGAFAAMSLGEGVIHFPCNEKITQAFRQACKEYYNRCILTGRCNGGPADIRDADDSESAAALADVLVLNSILFPEKENILMAKRACELFATWVVNYNPQMPEGSLFENISVEGGVIANIQNRHVGPGICTNSGRFLYKMGKISGDEAFIRMYENIKATAINCITTYDGEFFDKEPDKPFIKGMMSEQINLGDSLGISGETWRVSACWPSTDVLLSYFDKD